MLKARINLSKIPKELIYTKKNGEKVLDIKIFKYKEQKKSYINADGSTTTYHGFISCEPSQNKRKEGVDYILGNYQDTDTAEYKAEMDAKFPKDNNAAIMNEFKNNVQKVQQNNVLKFDATPVQDDLPF